MGEGSPSVETQLALINAQLGELSEDFAAMRALLEGPPWERSVRGRLHTLEGESQAARLAGEALAEARRERRLAVAARENTWRDRRNTRLKIAGAATALGAMLYPYLAHFGGW